MLLIKDLLNDEINYQKSQAQDVIETANTTLLGQANEAINTDLRVSQANALIRVVSRKRLLALDNSTFINRVFEIFRSRLPAPDEIRWCQTQLSGMSKRKFYSGMIDTQLWAPIRGTGWLMDKAAAQTLTLSEWFSFSIRFLLFKLLGGTVKGESN